MLSHAKLIAELEHGALIVTANQRLSRTLAAEYADAMKERGLRTWSTPEILNWQTWMRRLWFDGHAGRDVLLGDSQCQALWDDIVKQDLEFDVGGRIGQSAREAWVRQVDWQLPGDEIQRYGNREAKSFCRWVRRYEETLTEKQWVDPVQLASRVDVGAATARRVLLIGFYQLTPGQQALVDRLATAGWEIATEEREPATGPRRVIRAADRDQELLAAANWAKTRLESDPQQKLAVVVPDLRQRQNAAERFFARVLDPAALLPGASNGDREPLFHLSVGRPLDEQAMVYDALLALALIVRGLNSHQLSRILRSPYFIYSVQTHDCARLDARLRGQWFDAISVANLVWICAREPNLETMHGALEAVQNISANQTRMPATEWSTLFAAWLSALGWSQPRSLDSVEKQTKDKWGTLLFEMGRLDLLGRSLSAPQALGYLERLANSTEFQPERTDAPVQVLGMLEATGSRFDAVWITGLDDQTLPAAPRLTPFIPAAIQIEHDVTHASAENEIRFARQQLAELCATAPDVIMSWPEAVDNEARRASPLIASVIESDSDDGTALPVHAWAQTMAGAALEYPTDETGTDLEPGKIAAGGTQIFQLQSQCPFKAYAALRLNADSVDEPRPGISPRLRGVLAHHAMDVIWGKLRNQFTLLNLGADQRTTLINEAIDAAWTANRFEAQFIPDGLNELERRRLRARIGRHLEADTQRAEFEVARHERLDEVQIGGINLRIKVDRVDRLGDGRELIIDYKTGSVTANDALGPRPENPQLAVYAVANEAEVAGVLYGLLNSASDDYAGFVAEDGLVGNLKAFDNRHRRNEDADDWPALQVAWQDRLAGFAAEFQSGDARVDPTRNACRYCPFSASCRINTIRGEEGI